MKKSILILLAIFMCSCTAVPVQVAEPLAPGSYQEMGRNSCKKCSFLLIDVIPIKFSSMSKRAYDCAASGGDGLMNPDVSESYYMIPYETGNEFSREEIIEGISLIVLGGRPYFAGNVLSPGIYVTVLVPEAPIRIK